MYMLVCKKRKIENKYKEEQTNKKIKDTCIKGNTITVGSVKSGRVGCRGGGGQQISELYV